ncbi:MAG: phosphomethylpyrimidine synthase ThiC, partial [Euryarchaeota archaeon]|nr:phosphomethylpyrimidine synthase ThiC [Euryarchaeota archaeon]
MTLMLEAQRGIVSDELREVSRAEGIEEKVLLRRVAKGRVVIPRNSAGRELKPVGIGEGLRVKVNANIGTSPEHVSIEEELEKARVAVRYGADTLMDLSTGGDLRRIRREILKIPVPLGTVPIYEAGVLAAKRGSIVDMSEDELFSVIEAQAREGVDFMTVHAGITLEALEALEKSPRVTGIVSRGGSFLAAWMRHNERENPLYENFDYLLEIAREHDVTLSLGDALRPGSISDASDEAQLRELMILGRLVRRCREAGVQCMVEGPGHVPLNQIEANVLLEKRLCDGAPFYVLGPLVTDIAAGYDHIAAAIGGAIAAYAGADFLCYVTPAEHLALPSVEDVRVGVVASKIAAHAADLAKGRGKEIDEEMSRARVELDWEKQFK